MAFLPLYLTSGALVPLNDLPVGLQGLCLYNPMAHLLDLLRSALLGSVYQHVQGVRWSVPLVWALGLSLAALALYRVRRLRLLAV